MLVMLLYIAGALMASVFPHTLYVVTLVRKKNIIDIRSLM